ncbi:MAG TPA: prolyl oligopeptidase family serine peptidase [Longimicrobiaceae bacterium]|nr:prolyl oligopeptidase family serine peptidase [Longimicrobiaceae bacterium]
MPRSTLVRPRVLAAGLLAAAVLGGAPALPAQDGGYRTPPAPIPQILGTPPTPVVTVSRDKRTVALLGRENLPGIAELSEPDLRLAGFRINPANNGPANSRLAWSNAITFQDLETGARREVSLPAGSRVVFPAWSPDGTKLAFVRGAENGLELWVADARTGQAQRVTGPVLNAAYGSGYGWLPDGSGFLVRLVPPGRAAAPPRPRVPGGPLVQENLGRTAPGRTYQDLLQGPHDEALFEHYFTSQLARVPVGGGQPQPIGERGVISGAGVSPNGEYILVTRVKRPYSYVVPASRFPYEVVVLDRRGAVVKRVADIPLTDNLSTAFDAAPEGPRDVQWRADAPATLVWVEAQDKGDPRTEAAVRDRVLMLEAPFTGEPRRLIDLDQRYAGIAWGRADVALVYSSWWNTRREKHFLVNPSQPGAAPNLLVERSSQDRYNDPGSPVFTYTPAGFPVMQFTSDGGAFLVTGPGASPKGDYPFLGRFNLRSSGMEKLWQAFDPYYEQVVTVLDADGERILTRRESLTEPPNYYVRDLNGNQVRAITSFPDPAPQLAGIQRQLITYPRADGVTLSGTLYLPPGYDPQRDGRLPVLMWAYPTEFRDAAVAGQVQGSSNRFQRPGGISHLFLLTQGYAILDNPTMPIVGEGEKEPNDSYIEQLVASAQAAVDKVVEMGVGDRERIGIGGHSYGAFMTANLLAHSDLFRAGIARSGAYNRTLTPFGFQAEQRTFWEATDTYTRMSPFTYANRINEPILLIHGEADDNSGTFPMQSERMYAALKGHGATVRYVVLPYEAHGYRARESTLHTLWEMVTWMDRYVKNAPPRSQSQPQRAAGNNQ